MTKLATDFGPWNPGLRSPVPREIMPQVTLFRPENSTVDYPKALELADFSGFDESRVIAFRPERLVVHELLIRVAADISVPDGPSTEDLGVNFRAIVEMIEHNYLTKKNDRISTLFESLRVRTRTRTLELLREGLTPEPKSFAQSRTLLARLGFTRPKGPPRLTQEERDDAAFAYWRSLGATDSNDDSLIARVVGYVMEKVRARHGRMPAASELVAELVTNQICNREAGRLIGPLVAESIEEAIACEGLRRLPAQPRPVVMNTKGASAAGKSSMRPLQRELAERIGVSWADFAVISPDIFRKYLLDYDALGKHYKYAGMLASEELDIIDQKLDRYMAEKAARGEMPHLLIDRFRFDSFAPESDEPGSNLLTRFGAKVFMFFMVTAPHLTVERAWERGLRVGRYKTVDDLLFHNVEAYTGMPELFFTWAENREKEVHYEFLDNSVPVGQRPRTIAFGSNGRLVVLDAAAMLDIERFRHVNVDARSPDTVYSDPPGRDPSRDIGFLKACVERLDGVLFAEPGTGKVFFRVENGVAEVSDRELFRELAASEAGAVLRRLFPNAPDAEPGDDAGEWVDAREAFTLGRWSTQ